MVVGDAGTGFLCDLELDSGRAKQFRFLVQLLFSLAEGEIVSRGLGMLISGPDNWKRGEII